MRYLLVVILVFKGGKNMNYFIQFWSKIESCWMFKTTSKEGYESYKKDPDIELLSLIAVK
jgi:hypothetical protein